MEFNTFQSITNLISLTFVFKVGILLVLFLFIIFLGVIVRQLSTMNKIVTQPYLYPILHSFSLLLLCFGISLFVLALVIL
ncbi:MAG: DUF5657 family protein [Candidatus Levyibacteriota bacterium]